MSFLFRWFTNFFFTEEGVEDNKINVDEYKCEEEKSNRKVVSSNLLNEISWRSGIVTFLSNDYGLIDNALYFDWSVAPKLRQLRVGETVNYGVIKAGENESERIVEIEEKDEDFFDNETKEMPEKDSIISKSKQEGDSLLQSTERVLNGKISVKQGDDLFIHPLNIHCNLKNVRCDFIPIEGDWVSVVAEVETDPDAFNFAGEVLHLKYLKPLLIRNKIGTVTYLNQFRGRGCKGVIENEIFFSSDFCHLDFILALGDQVTYMAVESDQGGYKWRALSVQPTSEAEAGDRSTETRDLLRNKNNITIEGNVNIGPLEVGQTEETTLTVKNNGETNHVIQRTSFMIPRKRSQLTLKSPGRGQEILLEPGDSVDFVFICTSRFLGLSSEIFVFHFKNFKIGRRFRLNVNLGADVNTLISREEGDENGASLKQTLSWKNFDLTGAVYAKLSESVSRFNSSSKRTKMAQYNIPEKLFQLVLGENEAQNTSRITKKRILDFCPCLKENLDERNYKEKFHTLLYLEEIQNKIFYRKFDLRGVTLRKRDKYLSLDVGNLISGDPIFPVGTSVVVTQPWSEVNTDKQVGYIEESRDGVLLIKFHESFHGRYDESDCDLVFQPIRAGFVRSHSAVDMAVARLGMNWLFPASFNEKPPVLNVKSATSNGLSEADNLSMVDLECDIDENGFVIPKSDAQNEHPSEYSLKWFNPNLNTLQRDAVANVLEGKCRPLPYVVFGPPGTGKTITIVEIILQAYTLISDSRILVGTPSNSAADIICHYLISTGKFTPGELVRVLSRSRAASGDIPENIIPYCSTLIDDSLFESKHSNVAIRRWSDVTDCIGTQRIVVSTCNAIGVLHIHGLSQGHFSHIIIDEAAQAFEPEALIPICFLDPKRGQVILSGDTQQLGPVCTGFKDCTYDLSKSFLGRLCASQPYVRNRTLYPRTKGFDPRCITRLQVNYRSVPEILNLPSQLFYDSELIATVSQEEGPEAEIIRRFNFEKETRDSPPAIIFHGICGQTFQDENSFSWYNPLEIWQSVCYLKRLYSIDLKPEDIGIITPYQKQVEKLRKLLSALDVPVPKVGSVEEFQGQERYAIILSTVRSTTKCEENTLGFLASPRRLNVAITRARAILIIVGNPFTLKHDPYWSAVIQYCVNNGGCTGCSFEKLFLKAKNAEETDRQT